MSIKGLRKLKNRLEEKKKEKFRLTNDDDNDKND